MSSPIEVGAWGSYRATPTLLSIHFFQMLLHSRQDHLRMGNACFPRQDGKLVSTKSRENVGIAECLVQGIGRAD